MCALKRLIGACIVLGLCTASAHSFTGDIADGPEYSWVVEVVSVCKGDGGKTQNGTAYVKSRRLIYTSAHVVYKRQELCKGVRIVTRDDAGKVAQVVPARHIFVAEGYPAAESKLTREGNGVESRIKFDPSLPADAKQSILRRAANEDMAIIIPDGDVRVLATRPDILDERLPFMEMLTTVKRHREEWTKDFFYTRKPRTKLGTLLKDGVRG